MSAGYNPEFNPTGIEGGVDTNTLPWIALPQAPGMSIKPLRASSESGMFSVIVQLRAGTTLSGLVHLGAMDTMMLSGSMTYGSGPLASTLEPGIWGYIPANARIDQLRANTDTEFLANLYGPLAFLGSDGRNVTSLLTALDVQPAEVGQSQRELWIIRAERLFVDVGGLSVGRLCLVGSSRRQDDLGQAAQRGRMRCRVRL